jgi:FAD/FMN-containing dehydrogenase
MKKTLVADLERLVGPGNVAADPEQIERYSGDALGVFRAFQAVSRLSARAAAVVWPASAEDVSQVLRFANRNQIPIVPYGGGTGVMGAATPVEDCIILNLQRMNSVLKVSLEDMTARLQAGVVLEDAASTIKENGLLLGHDPWSRPIATVAGAISTDGMGYTAARHGSMGEQVLGLEAVLPDGEIIRTRALPKASYGPTLEHLFIGAEGTFGVITEATLKAFPQPEKRIVRGFDFPDFESGFHAVAQLYAEGVRPTMVDYGEESWSGDSPIDEGATLYIAFEGFAEDVETQLRRTQAICQRFEGQEGDQQEAQAFWEGRHASGERYKRDVLQSKNPAISRKRRSSYRMDYLHVAIPISRVMEYRRRCQEILDSNRILVREWSIWGRPEFFSFLIVQQEDEGQDTSMEMGNVVDNVLTLAQDMDGSMEYCHGVGVKLAHLMERELGSGMSALRKMKKALDPNNILNPGKLIG